MYYSAITNHLKKILPQSLQNQLNCTYIRPRG